MKDSKVCNSEIEIENIYYLNYINYLFLVMYD